MQQNGSLIGYQDQLLPLPQRQPVPRAEWVQMQTMRGARNHFRFSREQRCEMQRRYKEIFTDERNASETDSRDYKHQGRTDTNNDHWRTDPRRAAGLPSPRSAVP